LFVQDLEEGTPSRRGFRIHTQKNREKGEGIGRAFLTGYNTMLVEPASGDFEGVRTKCEEFSPFLKPFCYEGSAMGYPPKALLSFRLKESDFEEKMLSMKEEYLYLYYVGFGWWFSRRPYFLNQDHAPTKAIEKATQNFHPIYRYLCYDGYGFSMGFFDYFNDPEIMERCLNFEGYGRNDCFQGLGRSLWFVFMDEHDQIFESFSKVSEPYQGDCYGGLGLAVTFTNIDDLNFPFDFAQQIDIGYLDEYHLGMVFALAARRMNDENYFSQQVTSLEEDRQKSIYRSLEICDGCFETADSYEEWRDCTQRRIKNERLFQN
jgi:hypothetical protein